MVALNVSVTLAGGTDYSYLQARESTPPEPGVNEYKYYAPDVGVVLEESVDGGERVQLVRVSLD